MKNKLISFIRRKVLRIAEDRWDYQYAIGRWDVLRTREMKRLYAARDLLKKYALGGNILEIGCGEGVFFGTTLGADYHFYEGMDASELAIRKVQQTENSRFQSGNMEKYIPVHSPFTVIVLNEVIYYSKSPVGLLKRYAPYLAKEGVFLIGMGDSESNAAIWNSVAKVFLELESVKVQQDSTAWYYKIFKVK